MPKMANAENGGIPKMANAENAGPGMPKMTECRKWRNTENGGMQKMAECRK